MAGSRQDEKVPQPKRVGVREFRGDLSGFLRRARQGDTFLIMSRDQVLAEVRPPPTAERARRRPGALRGKIRGTPEFDTLPPDISAAMDGEAG
jgi:antitoxin (DNA-binding transcriptional repressor) of toxin-antitoxin stability system